jgi:uncharacterized protein (TIGR02271 family)
MISTHDLDRVEGATAYGADGEKLGKVGQVYLDDQTGQPSWLTVSTGLFGTSQSFVPLDGASFDGNDLRLAYSKDKVKDAPRVDADQHLEPEQEDHLYAYYGLSGTNRYDSPGVETSAGVDTGSPVTREGVADTDEAASAVLHEERLHVGTETREAGRARLRKYTTTQTETVSVPVTSEKLVVERTPVSGEGAVSSAPIAEGDQVEEITLREERPLVGKETVAVEEVSIGKETVSGSEQVSGEVRREEAEIETDGTITDDVRR